MWEGAQVYIWHYQELSSSNIFPLNAPFLGTLAHAVPRVEENLASLLCQFSAGKSFPFLIPEGVLGKTCTIKCFLLHMNIIQYAMYAEEVHSNILSVQFLYFEKRLDIKF